MNPSLLLLVLLAVFALTVAGLVLRPLWRARPVSSAQADAQATARAVLRERRREIEAALAHLPADAPERQAALAEFADQASAELGTAMNAAPTPAPGSRRRPVGVALIGSLLVLLPMGLYWVAGTPEAVQALRQSGDPHTPASLDALITELQARVATAPKDVDAWRMLGRAEMARGRTDAARTAFEQAQALAPQDAQIKVDYADALAQSQGAVLEGEPIALVREALTLDPRNPKALALAGAYEVGRNDFPAAIGLWQRLLEVLPPDSAQSRQIASFVEDLKAGRSPRIGEPQTTPAPPASAPAAGGNPAPSANSARTALGGRIEVAQKLADRVDPQATVFIVARTLDAEGRPSGPPVAVLRARGADLPLSFTLDDQHAMAPSARLSGVPSGTRMVVIARLSRSGQASAQPGDLQGASAPVLPGVSDLRVLIDTVVE